MAAPSGNNDQPWHFIVIDDKKILGEITKIQPYSRPILDAQFVIIVCGDRKLKKGQGVYRVLGAGLRCGHTKHSSCRTKYGDRFRMDGVVSC